MDSLVIVLLMAALLIQVPIALLVRVDARRQGFDNPEMYELGILVPMGGILVVPAYISKRRSLSRSDDAESVDTGRGGSDVNADADTDANAGSNDAGTPVDDDNSNRTDRETTSTDRDANSATAGDAVPSNSSRAQLTETEPDS
ncbi:hypothetical protein C483_16296 [Natrialba hulunbeirensis JCM 10989]|uniref:Uncharacterized protein n=1 Tax=Natrialba hulunbeirensis JCM 10989 TaxID=1227493 RepID=L9ZSX2_9EURY|nr:hypothetical protein [Natrialba hulunbeirensis]ELY88288.1 hypothetical protein C483_16296 [Natrialba hulunbeirensis JCM 10989]